MLVQIFIISTFTVNWVSSSIDGDSTTHNNKYKYYINKKGSSVIEIEPDGQCHFHHDENARWMKETRKDSMTELNYIQFRLMMGKCHIQSFFKPKPDTINSRNGNVSQPQHGQLKPQHQLPTLVWKKGKKPASTEDEEDLMGSNDNDDIDDLVLKSTQKPIDTLTMTMTKASQENKKNTNVTTEEKDEEDDPSTPTFPLIFPGTKWCGRGSAARGDDDLGIYVETDKCCREHDQCPENMASKECKFGLCNESEFTRSHCTCDESFMECLQRDRSYSSLASFKVANLYFNILKPFCYARRHPINRCRSTRITGECSEFEFDFRYPTVWQFFPAAPFRMNNVVENLIQANNGPPPQFGLPGPLNLPRPPGPPGPGPPPPLRPPQISHPALRPPYSTEDEDEEEPEDENK